MIHIVWTEPSISDLDGIHAFISRDSEVYADSVVLDIIEATECLTEYPTSGRIVPEVNQPRTREIIVGNYRVIHELNGDQIQIISVLHAARLFPEQ